MRAFFRCIAAVGLIAAGYVLGANGVLSPSLLRAQVGGEGPSPETAEKISAAYGSLKAVGDALQQDGRHQPATRGINTFAIMVGGVNAIDDLEKGRGVDPETFAGLYADEAVDEVAQFLDRDEKGRLTYKNKVVQMYPISILKALFAERLKYSGTGGEEF